MGTRKIKKRVKRATRIECGRLEYIGEDDEVFFPRKDQYVYVRKKTSPRDYAVLLAVAELAMGMEDDGDEEKEIPIEDVLALFKSMPDAYAMIARKIVSWNWTDLWSDDKEPPALPEPTLDVIMDLDFETDMMHLLGIVMEGSDDPKNAPSPS